MKKAVPIKKKRKQALRNNRPAKKNPAKPKKKKSVNRAPFPIVGIGGSAGGLEAFSMLLEKLSPDLGMAYVYIQHLSPNHESFLPEIISRKTEMKVHKVEDDMQIEKDHLYVIPSKYNVSIKDGKLKLSEQEKGGMLHAIDHFLTSMAPVYQQNGIGILLSGTGSDGTLGLMSIKAEGGITFAQDDSAQYQDMPYHAVEMGCVDFVMPPDKIAKELASLIKHPYAVTTQNEFFSEHKNELHKIP